MPLLDYPSTADREMLVFRPLVGIDGVSYISYKSFQPHAQYMSSSLPAIMTVLTW